MNKDSQLILLCNLITDYYCATLEKPSLGMIVRLNAYMYKIDSICAEFPEWREPARKLLFENNP